MTGFPRSNPRPDERLQRMLDDPKRYFAEARTRAHAQVRADERARVEAIWAARRARVRRWWPW